MLLLLLSTVIIIIIIITIIIPIITVNVNSAEWSSNRSVNITSDIQNCMSAEHESNLFSRLIVADRIGRHEVLFPIYYKGTIEDNERKNRQSRCILYL